jgi:hypothetical protein
MRRTLTVTTAVAVWLAAAVPAWAGVYNTSEPAVWPLPATFMEFQLRLGDLRSIAVEEQPPPLPKESAARLYYRKRVAELEAKERDGALTERDRIDLSAYYIGLRKFEEALRVLAPVEAVQDQNSFMILSNLATANQLLGRLDRAADYLQQALNAWPRVCVGFSSDQLSYYRLAERYQLKLIRLRQQEEQARPGRPVESVDALFPGVRFIGPSGEYEPGEIAPEQSDELPSGLTGLRVVGQLVLWLPFDDRLYWLLGELFNARGEVDAASRIFAELDGRNFKPPELRRHRHILEGVSKAAAELAGPQGPLLREEILWRLAPRGGTLPPGAGPLVNETAWATAYRLLSDDAGGIRPGNVAADGNLAGTAPAPPSPPAAWMPNGRDVGVGFVAGAAVAVLITLQFRGRRAGQPQRAG